MDGKFLGWPPVVRFSHCTLALVPRAATAWQKPIRKHKHYKRVPWTKFSRFLAGVPSRRTDHTAGCIPEWDESASAKSARSSQPASRRTVVVRLSCCRHFPWWFPARQLSWTRSHRTNRCNRELQQKLPQIKVPCSTIGLTSGGPMSFRGDTNRNRKLATT